MFEAVGGSGLAIVPGSALATDKSGSSALDFAQFLQQAQGEQESMLNSGARRERPPQSDRADDVKERETDLDDGAEDVGAADTLEVDENEEKEPAAELQVAAAGTARAGEEEVEQVADQPVDEMEGLIADAWKPPAVGEGKEAGEDARQGADESEAEPVEMPPVAMETLPEEAGNPLELLNFMELMDPDLVVEKSPEQIITRLVQAAGAQTPLMEEMAETTLPQVIRSLVSLVRQGGAEMRLKLQPGDLGEIELRVRTMEAAVRGEMIVQNPEVKQLLDHHMGRLRAALAEEGLELQEFSVDVGDSSHFAREDGEDGTREDTRQGQEALRAEVDEVAPVQAPRMPDNGDLDLMA